MQSAMNRSKRVFVLLTLAEVLPTLFSFQKIIWFFKVFSWLRNLWVIFILTKTCSFASQQVVVSIKYLNILSNTL